MQKLMNFKSTQVVNILKTHKQQHPFVIRVRSLISGWIIHQKALTILGSYSNASSYFIKFEVCVCMIVNLSDNYNSDNNNNNIIILL